MNARTTPSSLVIGHPVAAVSRGMVVRVLAAAVVVCLALAPALADDTLSLKGDIAIGADALTLADLVQGASGPLAEKPLFRSPALGQTGTIQAKRIVQAALDLGLGAVETRGRSQVQITRAARRLGAPEFETAVKQALDAQKLIEPASASVVLDGAPALLVPPDLKEPATADEVVFDRRSRRVSALVSVGSAPGERRASVRVTGTVIDTIEVAVLTRALARGETVQPSDLAVERRAREAAPNDSQTDGVQLAGRVARRPLPANTVLRLGDLARPELVARGDAVLVVYEVPGLSLTLRGRASDAGAMGDTIAVFNPQSKRTVQATVIGPGKAAALGMPSAKPANLADASAARP